MKKKKWISLALLLLVMGLFAPDSAETYQAATSYTNAKEFYESTALKGLPYHSESIDGTVYYATYSKLASSSTNLKYATVGFDITLSGNGYSVSFAVERFGNSVTLVDQVNSGGYQYDLYAVEDKELYRLAQAVDSANAAYVLDAPIIYVRIDAIMTTKQGGTPNGGITENGYGGISRWGTIYRLKNEEDLNSLKGIFSGHYFESYKEIDSELINPKLDIMYNIGSGAEPGTTGYSSASVSLNGTTLSDMLHQSGAVVKQSYKVLQKASLIDTGKNGINLTKTGYHLDLGKEWKKSDGTAFASGGKYMPREIVPAVGLGNKGVVLYANWKQNPYTISYQANGGSGTMADTDATYDTDVTLRANIFEREGYDFTGWSLTENGSVDFADGQVVTNLTSTNGGEVKLYAVWEKKVYTITLNDEGATTPGTDAYYELYSVGNYAEEECTTEITAVTVPEKTGYIFGGYFTNRMGSGDSYVDADGSITSGSTTFKADKTLYAEWTPVEYAVAYHANGGSGTMENTDMVYDTEENLRSNTFEKTGHDFMGWSDKADGDVLYKDKETVENLSTKDGDTIDLYAVWEPVTPQITLNTQEGSGGTTSFFEKYGVDFYTDNRFATTISKITNPTRTGYTFGGYFEDRTASGSAKIDSAGSITFADTAYIQDVTLYAKWTANTYTIKYNANGGTGTMADTSAVYDEETALRAIGFTRTGYEFSGWSKTKTGAVAFSNREIIKNLSDTNGAVVTLYAVWTPVTPQITLNTQEGSGGTTFFFEKYGVNFYTDNRFATTISKITNPTRTGYTFGGYFDDMSATGTVRIDASGTIKASNTTFVEDKTLYAKWTPNPYTIVYHANGGTGTMTDTQTVYDEEVVLRANGFSRTGYEFSGWATSAAGSVVYENRETVKNLTNVSGGKVHLYAVWTPLAPLITLNTQEGSGGTASFVEKYGVNFYTTKAFTNLISKITNPTRTGYDFGGYFADMSAGGDALIDASGNIKASNTAFLQDTTLYAKWTVKKFTITFDKQGGTLGSDSVTATYGQVIPDAEAPVRTGYTFKGYYTGKNGTGTVYYDEYMNPLVTYTGTSNITVYAYWVDETAPVIALTQSAGGGYWPDATWTNQQVTLHAAASDDGSGLSSVEIFHIAQDGTISSVARAASLNGVASKTLTFKNTTEGVVRYKAVATDMSGNTAESYSVVYYDTTAPTGVVGTFTITDGQVTIIVDVTDADPED